MTDFYIKDGITNSHRAEVTDQNALKVSSIDYINYTPAAKFFVNDTYGADMNYNFSNVSPGNSNELIYDGLDSVAWTGTIVNGTGWNLEDTNNPHTGSKNISAIAASLGSSIQFNRGSNVTMSAQTGFSIWIDVTDMGHVTLANLEFYAWNTAAAIVGNSVDIYDYTGGITVGYVNINIPLADMGLTTATFDAVRFQVTGRGGAILDIDDIVLLDPTGGSSIGTTTYTLTPEKGKQLLIDGFILNMADAYSATVSNATMPSLRYDGFLGMPTLSAGMLYRVIDNVDRVTFTALFKQLMDLLQFGHADFQGMGSDGVNSWFSLYIGLNAPITLNDDEKDKIEIILSDDFTPLLWFRWSADCRQRTIF